MAIGKTLMMLTQVLTGELIAMSWIARQPKSVSTTDMAHTNAISRTFLYRKLHISKQLLNLSQWRNLSSVMRLPVPSQSNIAISQQVSSLATMHQRSYFLITNSVTTAVNMARNKSRSPYALPH